MQLKTKLSQLVAGTLLIGATALAAPMSVSAHNDHDEFGAFLYAAACEDLDSDAVIEDIGDVELVKESDAIDEYWAVLGMDQDSPSRLYAEAEDIEDLTLDNLLASPHSIAVHETDDKDERVVACGDVTGAPALGTLMIVLREVDESGYEGRGYLAPDNDDDEEVQVLLGIWPAGEVVPLGTPMPTPAI